MTTHNMSRTKIYLLWNLMIRRCTRPTNPGYKYYGARGITVCTRWLSFINFFEDMGERPDGHSLERINNDLGYSKENCKWATNKEQQNNNRNCVNLTYNGKTQTVTQWAEELKIARTLIYDRLRLNWSVEKALTTSKGRWPK